MLRGILGSRRPQGPLPHAAGPRSGGIADQPSSLSGGRAGHCPLSGKGAAGL